MSDLLSLLTDRIMGLRSQGEPSSLSQAPQLPIAEAGVVDPEKAAMQLGGESLFSAGQKLLSRFATRNPPSLDELGALIKRAPRNISGLDLDTLNKLKGRFRMLGGS